MRTRYLLIALGLIFATGVASAMARIYFVSQAGIGIESLRETASQRVYTYTPMIVMALASMGYFSLWVMSFLTKSDRTFIILERMLWIMLTFSAIILAAIVFLTL